MNSDREDREWINEYMSLKQVNPGNPFTVPEGYFDDAAQRVTSYIKLDGLKDNATGGFALPENYFEELSDKINSRITVEALMNTEAPGFTVPEGYFDNLEQQIKSRVFVEEALSAPAEGFTVPEGYFSGLNDAILNKTVNQPVAKPRGAVIRMFSSAAFKYAVAASLTLFVGGAIFFNQYNDPTHQHDRTFLHQSLSSIPVNDIQSYLQLHLDASDTKVLMDDNDQLNDDKLSNDLQDYVDTSQ